MNSACRDLAFLLVSVYEAVCEAVGVMAALLDPRVQKARQDYMCERVAIA